jgi:hypothetical protein
MRIAALCSLLLIVELLNAQKKIGLTSPDGNIVYSFFNENGKMAYTVTYKKTPGH